MINDLVVPDELSEFPGAPYPVTLVDAAVASIRREAGWHIAPVVTETVTVDARGGTLLMLPTLRLASVASVRDMTDPALPVTLTEWRVSRSGMLYRPLGWPYGFATVEVTMTHGFERLPDELLIVVAERAQSAGDSSVSQRSTTVGPFSESVTYRTDAATNTSPLLAPYILPTRP